MERWRDGEMDAAGYIGEFNKEKGAAFSFFLVGFSLLFYFAGVVISIFVYFLTRRFLIFVKCWPPADW